MWVSDDIRRTFPIPKREIRRRKWRIALRHPLTWMPLAPIAGLVAAGNANPVLMTLAGVAALAMAGAVRLFWKKRSKSLEAEIVENLIHKSNLEQDSALVQLIRRLTRHGYESYAVTLGSFAGLKSEIERAIARDGEHTADKQQIATLVDDLVFHVVDQLEEMAKIEFRIKHEGRPAPAPDYEERLRLRWEEMSRRVSEAYDTLYHTWKNLDALIDPLPPVDVSGERLDDTIESLREEIRIADEVHARLHQTPGLFGGDRGEVDAAADAEIEATFEGRRMESE